MTTYLDLQTAGSHLFPFTPSEKSLFAHISDWYTQLSNVMNKAMADAQAEHELRGLSSHLLQDIGVERHTVRV